MERRNIFYPHLELNHGCPNGGVVPTPRHTPSWCGARLVNHRDKFTFTLIYRNKREKWIVWEERVRLRARHYTFMGAPIFISEG
jgi:hypothetical protein